MFCKKCGASIESGNKFCMKCGTKVEVIETVQEQPVFTQPVQSVEPPKESVESEFVPLQPSNPIDTVKEKNPMKGLLVAIRLIIAFIWAGAEWAVYTLINFDQFGLKFAATVSVTLVTWVILVLVTNTLGRKINK